jgi:hypothetical protein
MTGRHAPAKHEEDKVSQSRFDRASFEISLDQLVRLGKTGRLEVNGWALTLQGSQKAEIRATVAAVRRATGG